MKTAILLATSLGALSSAALIGQSDVEAAPEAPWEKSASLGLTLTEGNTKTALFTGDITASRKVDIHEFGLGARFAYGENDGERSAEQLSGYGQYNRLLDDRFFAYGRADALRDGVADVEYRLTLGPGAGYKFIKKEVAELSAEIGPTIIFEKLGSLDETAYGSVRVGENYTRKLSERARIWQSLEFLPQLDDFDNYILAFEIGVEADLTEKLRLRSYVKNLYDNQPAPGRKENDIQLVTGISYTF